MLWGLFGLFVGLFIMGIGVVPIAMIASLFKGEWSILWDLFFLIAFALGFRILGYYLMDKNLEDDETVHYHHYIKEHGLED